MGGWRAGEDDQGKGQRFPVRRSRLNPRFDDEGGDRNDVTLKVVP